MNPLRLRVKGPNGQAKTVTCEGAETLDAFLNRTCELFQTTNLTMLCGYPPQLCTAYKLTLLSDILKSGDSVILREGLVETLPLPPPQATATSNSDKFSSHTDLANVKSPNENKWVCSACTFENDEILNPTQSCEICSTVRLFSSVVDSGSSSRAGIVASKHCIPDDNSCLFHAIIFLLNRTESTLNMRQIIANTVHDNPNQWSDAILGKSRNEYIAYILDSTKWGGQVELNILCSIVGVEIAAIDIQSGRLDIYGQDAGYTHRVYMLFSGIHFDAVVFADHFNGYKTKQVLKGDQNARIGVEKLATTLRNQGSFTDQQTMQLICQICGYEMNGDYEARLHAGGTGHTEFRMKKSM